MRILLHWRTKSRVTRMLILTIWSSICYKCWFKKRVNMLRNQSTPTEPRDLFPCIPCTNIPGVTTSRLTPKVAKILRSTKTTESTSISDSFDFIVNQHLFDQIFDLNPPPFNLTALLVKLIYMYQYIMCLFWLSSREVILRNRKLWLAKKTFRCGSSACSLYLSQRYSPGLEENNMYYTRHLILPLPEIHHSSST